MEDSASSKRYYDPSATIPEDQKRQRGEIDYDFDDRKCISRIVVRKSDFAKIIGKGGAMVNQIKAKCGASIKGTEVDDENRIVTMTGSLKQVLECFDLICEVLHSNFMQSNMIFNEVFAINLLIDHSKAGKVVGSKGGNIQTLKTKSGCAQIRILKDPILVSGQALRILIFEGALPNICKAHYLTQETILPDGAMQALHVAAEGLSLGSLLSYGVPAETIGQLAGLQEVLQQCGLKLSVHTLNEMSQQSAPVAYEDDDAGKMVFYIPKEAAGGVIGKGGSVLNELMAEFGVKMFVDREEYQNMRKVVINSDNSQSMQAAKEKILSLCQISVGNDDGRT